MFYMSNTVLRQRRGETIPVIVRANRRVHASSIKVEVVSSSIPGTSPVNSRDTGPTVAIVAEAPQSAGIESDVPATDEEGMWSTCIPSSGRGNQPNVYIRMKG